MDNRDGYCMSNSKVCNRCVMDTTDPSITFDKDGNCNYCNDTLKRMPSEYFPNEEGQRKLHDLIETVKADGKDREYDCMVGVSGGVDSSYVLFLGFQLGLRMLAVHVDDGLDTPVAIDNMEKLCQAAHAELLLVKPDINQYKDLLRSFFLARVPGLGIVQDNIILRALEDTAKKCKIKHNFSGANFSLECILQRGKFPVTAVDKRHINGIHNRFRKGKIDKIQLYSIFGHYIASRYMSKVTTSRILNYIDYRLETALADLKGFCDFTYYGGKHYESILTRFLQCWYLPQKYNFDKRKSHFSSMIVSGQMTREDALNRLSKPAYASEEMLEDDIHFLANYLDMGKDEFMELLAMPPREETDYPVSILNHLAPLARKFRKYIG